MINTYIIEQLGLTNEQFSQLEERHALIEPITADYTTPAEKRRLKQEACIQLDVNERTLRKYIKSYRDYGITGLIRKVRHDKGKNRLFDPLLASKALELLQENPYRSMTMVHEMLCDDPQLRENAKIISSGTLYYHLKRSGYSFKNRKGNTAQKVYHRFEAQYANQLWQGDARHGIVLPHPEKANKTKMCYLFAWIDDYSRKIIFAKYYWDEKLPRLEDCLRQAILKWGIPEKIYVDNGSVYISKQFNIIVNNIGIRKIHHLPYRAWCKGKVESMMKRLKKFQREAVLAGIKTIDELNEILWAWMEQEYHNRVHSSTGQTPNERFSDSIQIYEPKRITSLDTFNSFFLWQDTRVINKYGYISLLKNTYRIRNIGIGETVKVYFDPYDLTDVSIYHKEKYIDTVKAYKLTNAQYSKIPEEQKNSSQVSADSKRYLKKLLKKNLEQKKNLSNQGFSNLVQE
jgi:putative transposase